MIAVAATVTAAQPEVDRRVAMGWSAPKLKPAMTVSQTPAEPAMLPALAKAYPLFAVTVWFAPKVKSVTTEIL